MRLRSLSALGAFAVLAALLTVSAASGASSAPKKTYIVQMLDAAAQEGYEPIWLTGSNSYLASFAEWNASGNGDNVYLPANAPTTLHLRLTNANGTLTAAWSQDGSTWERRRMPEPIRYSI